jgi:hypothetical protein
MEPLRPDAAPLFRSENWLIVPAIEAITAPTLTEVQAASALDFTLMAFDNNTDRPSQDTPLATEDRRLGDDKQFQMFDVTTFSGGNLSFAVDPQAPVGDPAKKLWELLEDGLNAFLVNRQAKLRASALAVGDFVNTYPVEFAPAFIIPSGTGASLQGGARSVFRLTGEPAYLKPIVAAA